MAIVILLMKINNASDTEDCKKSLFGITMRLVEIINYILQEKIID